MNPQDRPPREARIALLIDADNSPASKIDVILAELAKLGVANIRRAYGNWKKSELKGWEAVLHEHAIRPIQQFDYSKGKNATDMVMAIDALELLYTDQPEAFGIVSSDADFTPLVMHLRAKGATVYGFGAKKTPEPFVNACSRFLYLEALGAPEADAPAVRGGGREARRPAGDDLRRELRQDARLMTLLRNAVASGAGDEGWSALSAVRNQISNQASFDPRNYGFKKFSDLMEATGLFEIDRRAQQVQVRDKAQGRTDAATPPADGSWVAFPTASTEHAPKSTGRSAGRSAGRRRAPSPPTSPPNSPPTASSTAPAPSSAPAPEPAPAPEVTPAQVPGPTADAPAKRARRRPASKKTASAA
jgi:uncharacterized LabA/DUF88 family protein